MPEGCLFNTQSLTSTNDDYTNSTKNADKSSQLRLTNSASDNSGSNDLSDDDGGESGNNEGI